MKALIPATDGVKDLALFHLLFRLQEEGVLRRTFLPD